MKKRITSNNIPPNIKKAMANTMYDTPAINSLGAKRENKYHNKKVVFDGQTFDSTRELEHWKMLLSLEHSGFICNLRRQVIFELNLCAECGKIGAFSYKYKADFTYYDYRIAKVIVADTKPKAGKDGKRYLTPEFKKKYKLMKKIHNIEITIL